MNPVTTLISRREILKRSVGGLLVIGPLGAWATMLNARAYNLCDQYTCHLKRQYCSGPNNADLVQNWQCVDRYNPGYLCFWTQYTQVNHPACQAEKTALQSAANSLLAAAEMGYPGSQWGEVRARTYPNYAGAYEDFRLVPLTGYVYDSANSASWQYAILLEQYRLYVSTEIGYGGSYYGMLRARATAVGPWERYNLISLDNGYWAIQSQANGLYVSTELGYGGSDYAMLRARASAVGPWEQYNMYGN